MEARKRVFLIVLDSVGIGAAPDAPEYGDEGSNTVYAASTSEYFHTPNLQKLGFFILREPGRRVLRRLKILWGQ